MVLVEELMSVRQTKIIAQIKESFLVLCQQYEVQGKQIEALARALLEDGCIVGRSGKAAAAQLHQYHEIGEQMKTLGTAIDLLGGRPVLTGEPAVKVISGTRRELKARGIRVPRGG
jgi:hypothetical protein